MGVRDSTVCMCRFNVWCFESKEFNNLWILSNCIKISDVFVRGKTRLGVFEVMTLKIKVYLSSSCWWRKKRSVRRHILEFSEVWTPWALSIGLKSREGSMKAVDYIGNGKRKEWMKWKSLNNEDSKENYRRLRNEFERATEKAKNESLESICDDVMEFQRKGLYDSVYLKTSSESKECDSKH